MHLYSVFLQYSMHFTTTPHSPIYTNVHIVMLDAAKQDDNQEQSGVQCLAHGHFDIVDGGAEYRNFWASR